MIDSKIHTVKDTKKKGTRISYRRGPVIDQTHLSFQRGQEAWLAEFVKWWGRKQRSSFSSQTSVESSIKC